MQENIPPVPENKNRFKSQISEEIYDENNPPSDETIKQMVDFDELCFKGFGMTTAEKHAPPLITADDIKDGINHKKNIFVIRRDIEGNIVSVVQTFIKGKEGQEKEVHLMSMALHPNYRGSGMAKSLLEGVYQEAVSQNITKVTLRVDPLNTPAISKYLKEDFVVVGGRIRKFDDEHQNVVTLAMTKRLSDQPVFDDARSSEVIPLEDWNRISQLAQEGYGGIAIENGNLLMKKLSDKSRASFSPWS